MSHLEGNPSAASSRVVASSAANSSSVEAGGSAASSAPGSNPVDVGELPVAVLQPPSTAETTVSENKELFGHDPATYGRPAKAKAKARVAKCAKQSATAQLERANMVVDVSL